MTKRKTYIPLKKILYWWRKKNILKALRSEIFPKAFKINERKISCVLWTKRTRVIESEIRFRSTITSIKNTINIYQIKKKKELWKVQPMLQKLSIAIAQLNLVNTFKILLNQIHELICSIDRSKEVTEKCTIITLKQHWLYKTEYLIH